MNTQARSLKLEVLTAKPAPMPLGPEVSVIMVVYRTGPALSESIAHILAEPQVDEFIIVDNGSPPEDAAMLRRLGEREPRVRLLQGQGNIGFARGANLGAASSEGRHLVFINPDAFIQPGCVAALLAAREGRASPCVVGARILNENGTEQRGGRRGEVTPVTTLLSFSHVTGSDNLRRFEIHREREPLPRTAIPIPTISGACFHLTAEDFRALGGFDEGYFLHVEDIDLCWRSRRAGGEVIFEPAATVVHLGSSSRSHPVVVEFHKGRGLIRYFLKRTDNPFKYLAILAMSPLIMLAAVSRPALWVLQGRA